MRLRREVHFKLPKAESLAVLFPKLIEVLQHFGCSAPVIIFRMENMPGQRSNASARVIKAFPEMHSFQQIEVDVVSPGETLTVLTNRPSESSGNSVLPIESVAIDTLEKISNGVPKSYPFFVAEFLFTAVPFLEKGIRNTAQSISEFLSATSESLEGAEIPGVYLGNSYTPSGRRCTLNVAVEEPAPEFDVKKLLDFGDASEFIASLGKVERTRMYPLFSNEDNETFDMLSERSQKIIDEYEATMTDSVDRITALRHSCWVGTTCCGMNDLVLE